jgi:TnpA family transposase
MRRRRALTSAQLVTLLTEPDMARHWALNTADLAVIGRRRRDRHRLGFALQLCTLRYPGRLPRPGECVPAEALRFVARQLGTGSGALATCAARPQTNWDAASSPRARVPASALAAAKTRLGRHVRQLLA